MWLIFFFNNRNTHKYQSREFTLHSIWVCDTLLFTSAYGLYTSYWEHQNKILPMHSLKIVFLSRLSFSISPYERQDGRSDRKWTMWQEHNFIEKNRTKLEEFLFDAHNVYPLIDAKVYRRVFHTRTECSVNSLANFLFHLSHVQCTTDRSTTKH